jgi:xylose isomerase
MDERYSGWNDGLGRTIIDDGVPFGPHPRSARQEAFEDLVNRYE